jgi:hypothetical protein
MFVLMAASIQDKFIKVEPNGNTKLEQCLKVSLNIPTPTFILFRASSKSTFHGIRVTLDW